MTPRRLIRGVRERRQRLGITWQKRRSGSPHDPADPTETEIGVWRRLWGDRDGATLVLVAISLPVLLTIAGLGVDVGWWYTVHRQNQSAADAAAVSAAYEIIDGHTVGSTTAVTDYLVPPAQNAAHLNGYDGPDLVAAAYQSSAAVCADPGKTKSYVCFEYGDQFINGGVEVVLRQPQGGLFSNFASLPGVTVANRAVALVESGGIACNLALAPTGSKTLWLSGSANINFYGCGAAANSTSTGAITIQGGAGFSFSAAWLLTAGSETINGNPPITVPTTTQFGPTVPDPYSCNPPQLGCAGTITWPTVSGSEKSSPTTGGTTIGPGVYAGPMTFPAGTTTLQSGVYIIDGENNQDAAFVVGSGSTVIGTGVTIIATSAGNTTKGGGFDINGGTVELSAPTTSPQTGIPSGLLFAQDPNHADTKANGNGKEADSTITATGSTSLTGTLYTPATNVTFLGNANSTCFIVIALTIEMNGASQMSGNAAACSAAGVTPPQLFTVVLGE
jgi:Putative Flp pilus-assembly TadE/G-like